MGWEHRSTVEETDNAEYYYTTSMNIAVNVLLASPKNATGAFIYLENILPALCEIDAQVTYHLVGSAETIAYFKTRLRRFSNVRYRICDIRRDFVVNPWRALMKLTAKLRKDNELRGRIVAREIQAYLHTEEIAVYFSPSGSIYPQGLQGVRHVTTILDLQPEYFPGNFPPNYLKERRQAAEYAVKRSARLIAISEFTKKTLVETYTADPKKVEVIYLAPHRMSERAGTLVLPEDFIFYPAALWPHKNHCVLVKALGVLKDRFPSLHLVCTGMVKRKDVKAAVDALTEEEGLIERVHFLGYVAEDDMHTVYKKAKALVFPSSFEGFGIPLVEAFQFGVPVIAANNTSITEVVDGAGALVPTGDVAALAEAIEKVIGDKHFRARLIEKGHERAKLFFWEKAARETLTVLVGK